MCDAWRGILGRRHYPIQLGQNGRGRDDPGEIRLQQSKIMRADCAGSAPAAARPKPSTASLTTVRSNPRPAAARTVELTQKPATAPVTTRRVISCSRRYCARSRLAPGGPGAAHRRKTRGIGVKIRARVWITVPDMEHRQTRLTEGHSKCRDPLRGIWMNANPSPHQCVAASQAAYRQSSELACHLSRTGKSIAGTYAPADAIAIFPCGRWRRD
jgi:hypothetical protein